MQQEGPSQGSHPGTKTGQNNKAIAAANVTDFFAFNVHFEEWADHDLTADAAFEGKLPSNLKPNETWGKL